jgi:hypothetical protein
MIHTIWVDDRVGTDVIYYKKGYMSVGINENNDKFKAVQLNTSLHTDGARIIYNIPSDSHVRLELYDLQGRFLANPVDEFKLSGEHEFSIDNTDYNLTNGVYYVSLNTTFEAINTKIILVK